jgi:hypothetical protein
VAYRDALGPAEGSVATWPAPFVTHLTEDGVDRRFIQEAGRPGRSNPTFQK